MKKLNLKILLTIFVTINIICMEDDKHKIYNFLKQTNQELDVIDSSFLEDCNFFAKNINDKNKANILKNIEIIKAIGIKDNVYIFYILRILNNNKNEKIIISLLKRIYESK